MQFALDCWDEWKKHEFDGISEMERCGKSNSRIKKHLKLFDGNWNRLQSS